MRITLADIARKAGVSKMTVSRVISGKGQIAAETRVRVMRIIDEMGYHPNLIARSLASRRSMILGVIIPWKERLLLDNYFAQVLSGVTDVALRHNYRILLCPVEIDRSDRKQYVNITRTRLLDGLVLVQIKTDDPNIDGLADSGFPFVLVNQRRYSKNCSFVDSQNIQGAQTAVRYLYDRGHRDIAFVAGSMDESNGRDRFQGYRQTIKALGLPFREERVVYGDFSEETAYRESARLFQAGGRPTAVFCSDDYMAIGVMRRIRESGFRVPEDVAVVGFDDIEMAAHLQPALTTVRQQMVELGRTSVDILLAQIEGGRKASVRRLLPTELVKRNSA
jgi:LacI family transcriptional regulator